MYDFIILLLHWLRIIVEETEKWGLKQNNQDINLNGHNVR